MPLPLDLDFERDPSASPKRMNRATQHIDTRFKALELPAKSLDGVLAQIQSVGLQRLTDALDPIYNELTAIASSFGVILNTSSASSVAIATGHATFTLPQGQKDAFAYTGWSLVTSQADATNAMLGRFVSYDKASGALVLDIVSTSGSGSHADWLITPTVSPAILSGSADAGSDVPTGVPAIAARWLRSKVAGRRPGAGAVRTLLDGEPFINQADGVLCWLDAAGTLQATPLSAVATTDQVATAIAAALNGLVANAPAALNTLRELADAINDDAGFSATMMTALGNRLRVDAAQGLGATQVAQALGNLGLNAVGQVGNLIDNAEMRVNTRLGPYTDVSSGASTPAMTLDRWFAYRAAYAAGLTVSQVAGPAGFASAARLQRTAGNASAASCSFIQIIESADCARFAGKTMTVGAILTAGATFSGGGVASIYLVTGTGSDQGRAALVSTGWTGGAGQSVAVAVAGAASRLSATFDIPAGTTEIAIGVVFVPSGTAGAADYLDVTGVTVEEGPNLGPIQRQDRTTETTRCRRHARPVSANARAYATGAGQYVDASISWEAMRATPTAVATSAATTANLAGVSFFGLTATGGRYEISSAAAGDFYALAASYLLSADL